MSEPGETFITSEEKNWAVLAHLSAFLGFPVPAIGAVLGPFLVWIFKKDALPFVDDQAKEALNFNISIIIYGFISYILCIIFVGFLLIGIVFAFWVIMTIVAMLKAQDGKRYRYPLTMRFIK